MAGTRERRRTPKPSTSQMVNLVLASKIGDQVLVAGEEVKLKFFRDQAVHENEWIGREAGII